MALFKILKGNESTLPSTITEGYMYITKDTGNIYVDISSTERIQLNADKAVRIIGTDTSGNEVDLTYEEIIQALGSKMETQDPIGIGNFILMTADGKTVTLTQDGEHLQVNSENLATISYVDDMIGDIATLLAAI